jgi:hypothetical protein
MGYIAVRSVLSAARTAVSLVPTDTVQSVFAIGHTLLPLVVVVFNP